MYKRVTTVGASPPPGGRRDRMVVGLQQSVESVPITSKVVIYNYQCNQCLSLDQGKVDNSM